MKAQWRVNASRFLKEYLSLIPFRKLLSMLYGFEIEDRILPTAESLRKLGYEPKVESVTNSITIFCQATLLDVRLCMCMTTVQNRAIRMILEGLLDLRLGHVFDEYISKKMIGMVVQPDGLRKFYIMRSSPREPIE